MNIQKQKAPTPGEVQGAKTLHPKVLVKANTFKIKKLSQVKNLKKLASKQEKDSIFFQTFNSLKETFKKARAYHRPN